MKNVETTPVFHCVTTVHWCSIIIDFDIDKKFTNRKGCGNSAGLLFWSVLSRETWKLKKIRWNTLLVWMSHVQSTFVNRKNVTAFENQKSWNFGAADDTCSPKGLLWKKIHRHQLFVKERNKKTNSNCAKKRLVSHFFIKISKYLRRVFLKPSNTFYRRLILSTESHIDVTLFDKLLLGFICHIFFMSSTESSLST